jgi:glycosyltransferase involved in cell wall biosynthesis
LRLKAPWGVRVLLMLPIWWAFVFFAILRTKCDIIQAIDLDSIMPAEIAAMLKGKPVIYKIYDIYADRAALPTAVRKIAVFFEKLFMRPADAVIITSEAQIKEVNGIPNKNIVTIYNPPPDYQKKFKQPPDDVFTLFFAGVLYRARAPNIDKVFQAVKDIGGVKLVIAGYGDMEEDIKQLVKQADGKVEFLGRLTYQQVLERTVSSDLLFALYGSNTPTTKYASCNKVMEAMMAQKPVLVPRDTAMADMIKTEDSGMVVDPESVSEIRQAVLTLKSDAALYRRLGENARRAYERTYNREVMEKRLLDLYAKILDKS